VGAAVVDLRDRASASRSGKPASATTALGIPRTMRDAFRRNSRADLDG
jgi:hypothetical protein